MHDTFEQNDNCSSRRQGMQVPYNSQLKDRSPPILAFSLFGSLASLASCEILLFDQSLPIQFHPSLITLRGPETKVPEFQVQNTSQSLLMASSSSAFTDTTARRFLAPVSPLWLHLLFLFPLSLLRSSHTHQQNGNACGLSSPSSTVTSEEA